MLTLQRTASLGPLIQMILEMIDDSIRFMVLLTIIMMRFVFAVYYAVDGDIHTDNAEQDLSALTGVALFIFQALLGQQEWDLIRSMDETVGGGRSRILELLLILFTIIGGILLLNLLIALMASTYERVREVGNRKVNFNRIGHTYSVINQNALMPPPFNILVAAFTLLWIIFDILVRLMTCGCFTINLQSISRIKYSLRHNLISLQEAESSKHSYSKLNKLLDINYTDLKGAQKLKLPKRSSNESNPKNRQSSSYLSLPYTEELHDNPTQIQGIKYHKNHNYGIPLSHQKSIYRNDSILDQNENICFERLPSRCIGWKDFLLKKTFCRYCRHDMKHEIGDIQTYFDLFRHYRILDDEDKNLMKHLLKNRKLCPICFRPSIS